MAESSQPAFNTAPYNRAEQTNSAKNATHGVPLACLLLP